MTKPSSDSFESSSTQSSDERIEAFSILYVVFEHDTSACKLGGTNMSKVHNSNNQPSKKDQIKPLGSSHHISMLRKLLV